MSNFQIFTPHNQLCLVAPESSTDVKSWKVTSQRGVQSGVGCRVSGAGAWASLDGNIFFTIKHLNKSKTYDMMKKEYNISGGVSAFWSWLGVSANASTHKEEIHKVFEEVSDSQDVTGSAHVSLSVSGQYPNVAVDASGYVMVLQIEDNSGNTYRMMSTDDPNSDTGAQDQNGNALPVTNNQSTITI